MGLGAKRSVFSGWKRLDGVGPGGTRGGRMIRFAESEAESARLICFVPLTLP